MRIGGTTSDTRRVIGGRSAGIGKGISSSNITIQGNSIGVGADGHTPVSNDYGITIAGGSTNNLIGGATSGAGNVITFNNSAGISLSQYYLAPITTGNAILGNSIHDNNNLYFNDAGLGIDINRQDLCQGLDGPNPNDLRDADFGNNDLQNYPILTNVINGSGSTTIQGALNSTPNSTFRVEFFSNSTVKVNGYSEGKTYLGFKDVTTDANGNVSFNVPLTTPSTSGMYISSTATNSGNNTSEFSLAFQSPLNSPPTANAGGPYVVAEGTNLQLNGSGSSDPDGNLQTYDWDLDYNGITFDVNASGVQPNVSFNDNFAPRMLPLRVTDSGGLSNIATTTLAVSNVVPIATASGSTTGVSNQPLPFSFLATDLSSVDTATGFRFDVNWGDSSASAFTGVTTTATIHAFAVGTYNVTMTATDKDGGISAIKTIAVTITPYAFITDPCDANKTALVIGGTSSNDQITVNPGGGSANIKSHHNVGGLPDDLQFTLIEPLRTMFKDEVRAVGSKLGLPDSLVWRHPFPGPGLGIRIIGEVTAERLDILRRADSIARAELAAAKLERDIWQFPVVLLADVRSVGVQGDGRTYGHPIVLRPVTSDDAMTADWAKLPHELLEKISTRITNECPEVNRVVVDITSKPPGTIEWE